MEHSEVGGSLVIVEILPCNIPQIPQNERCKDFNEIELACVLSYV